MDISDFISKQHLYNAEGKWNRWHTSRQTCRAGQLSMCGSANQKPPPVPSLG